MPRAVTPIDRRVARTTGAGGDFMNMGNRETRNAALAALVIMLVFGLGAFYLPTIMLVLGSYSTTVAGVFGGLFVLAFFAVFWLRGRFQDKRRD